MTHAAAVRPMTPDEYDAWIVGEIAAYAADLARASGSTLEEAHLRAEQQTRELLPDGPATPGAFLLRVLDEGGAPVGVLWLGPHPQRRGAGWVYDIEIDEARRGQGLGRAAMLAAERIGREAGWTALGLNVFGHNPGARALYDSLGYEVAATLMSKPLD
jgi:ribosomal protein S18 acetylase RimI-like enzyme